MTPLERAAAGWLPPPALTVSEWADQYRYLSPEESPGQPGQWRTSLTPYLREIMDCLSVRHPAREVWFVKANQIAGTECGNNFIGYIIDIEPQPVLHVQPTVDLGKRWSRQRFAKMIASCSSLREKIKPAKSRESSNTLLSKEFDGGQIVIGGANSAASLRSMPTGIIYLDEVDGYPEDVDDEGDPVKLAMKRCDGPVYFRRKVLVTSTPTEESSSRVMPGYLSTDMRKYFVPCPQCGYLQALDFKRLKWEWGRPQSVVYACEKGCEIHEHHKPQMLADGEWRAERPGYANGERVGFHLNALYSPLGWRSWSAIAAEYEAAKARMDAGDPSLMEPFVNTILAETWKDAAEVSNPQQLRERAEPYQLRVAPRGVITITAGVDVQADRLEITAWGWGADEEAWIVDRDVFYGNPALLEVWGQLLERIRAPIQREDGARLNIAAVGVDSGGHWTHEVYQFCRVNAHRHVFAIKGNAYPNRPILAKPSMVDVNFKGELSKEGCKLWHVGTVAAKHLLYRRLQLESPGPGYIHFSAELTPDFYEQLTAERWRTIYHKGKKPRSEWTKDPGKRNEELDKAIYAMAAAHYCGIPKFKAPDWDRLEKLNTASIQPRAEASVKTQPVAAQSVSAPRVLSKGLRR